MNINNASKLYASQEALSASNYHSQLNSQVTWMESDFFIFVLKLNLLKKQLREICEGELNLKY